MEGRIGRFLRAARTLLWMQLAAAVLAVGLAAWAVLAVRDLAADRDRLQERVAQLESAPREAGAPLPVEPVLPEGNGVAPAPLPSAPSPAPTNQVVPSPAPTDAGPQPLPPPPPVRTPNPTPTPAPPTPDPNPTAGDDTPVRTPIRPRPGDCATAPTDPRCRTGRWTIVPGATVARPPVRHPNSERQPAANRQTPTRQESIR